MNAAQSGGHTGGGSMGKKGSQMELARSLPNSSAHRPAYCAIVRGIKVSPDCKLISALLSAQRVDGDSPSATATATAIATALASIYLSVRLSVYLALLLSCCSFQLQMLAAANGEQL
ncbi:hypothetical protein ACLKA6_008351 [Drosophila palustris]